MFSYLKSTTSVVQVFNILNNSTIHPITNLVTFFKKKKISNVIMKKTCSILPIWIELRCPLYIISRNYAHGNVESHQNASKGYPMEIKKSFYMSAPIPPILPLFVNSSTFYKMNLLYVDMSFPSIQLEIFNFNGHWCLGPSVKKA